MRIIAAGASEHYGVAGRRAIISLTMLRRLLVFFGYLGLTLLVIGITAGLVAYGSGYSYNFKTGRIIRTGLIILQSTPSGVPVVLDGKTKKKTPYRVSVEAGNYHVSLSRDGYYSWSKLVRVIASEVTLAQYIYLIPKKPVVTTLDVKPSIISQSISRDHHHLAYVAGGGDSAVYTLDLTNQNAKPVRIYTPKAATDTTAAEALNSVTWSADASHLLIGSTLDPSGPTYRIVNATGGDGINLTTQYGFNFSSIQFAGSGWQQMYWNSPDGLRKLDLNAQTVSGVLADKVVQLTVYQDHVIYVQTTDLGRSLWSIDNRGHKQELVQALPESDVYSIAATTYNNQDEVAVVPAKTGIGTIYSGVYGSSPTSKVVAHDVQTASFSDDGHILLFYAPNTVQTYDLERSQVDSETVTYTFPKIANLTQLSWFDDFHVLMVEGSQLVWSEFDGANQVDLGSQSDSLPAYSSSDLKSIYFYQPTASDVHLSQMVIKP